MKLDIKALKRQISIKLGSFEENQSYDLKYDFMDQVLEQVKLEPKHLVLDLGSGFGTLALAVAPLVKKVVAVDINPELINEGIRFGKNNGIENIEYLYSDAEKIEIGNETFDHVFCYFSAHHFGNLKQALSEAYRVLRTNGKITILDYAVSEQDFLRDFANKIETLRDPGHVSLYSLQDWKELLVSQGFKYMNTETRKQIIDFDRWSDGAGTPEFIKNHLKQVLLNCSEETKKHYEIVVKADKIYFEYSEACLIAQK